MGSDYLVFLQRKFSASDLTGWFARLVSQCFMALMRGLHGCGKLLLVVVLAFDSVGAATRSPCLNSLGTYTVNCQESNELHLISLLSRSVLVKLLI